MLGRTVAELEETMTASEFLQWVALDSISPILGPDRGDLRSGIQSALLANIHRDSKIKPQPFSPTDFMPFMDAFKPEPEMTPEMQKAHSKLMAEILEAGSDSK